MFPCVQVDTGPYGDFFSVRVCTKYNFWTKRVSFRFFLAVLVLVFFFTTVLAKSAGTTTFEMPYFFALEKSLPSASPSGKHVLSTPS